MQLLCDKSIVMSRQRIIISVIVIFVFALLWNGLVHMVILKGANLALTEFARPASERNMAVALILMLGIAIIFVLSFNHYVREGGVKEGIQHGLIFAIIAGLLVDLNQYLVYPVPASLAAKWFVFGAVEFVCYGIIVGLLHNKKLNE